MLKSDTDLSTRRNARRPWRTLAHSVVARLASDTGGWSIRSDHQIQSDTPAEPGGVYKDLCLVSTGTESEELAEEEARFQEWLWADMPANEDPGDRGRIRFLLGR